jgi:predicted nucleic acid-binding protein
LISRSKIQIVIDASSALSEILPDEKQPSPKIRKYFLRFENQEIDFLAPMLLKYEMANALKSAVLQKRLALNLAKEILVKFLQLPIIYIETDFQKALDLAIKHKISAYDASYIQLAKTRNLKFISLDAKLTRLAKREN